MTIALIILSCLLWLASLFLLAKRQMLAPAASYIALLLLSFADNADGSPLLPINSVILIGWLAMTLVVMIASMLQPPAIQAQSRGTGYMTIGALTGMVVGLLSFSFAQAISIIYSCMILATVTGTFLGFLMFTGTPRGKDVALRTGRFFRYLLAKGFPTAITVMMLGIAAVLAVSIYQ